MFEGLVPFILTLVVAIVIYQYLPQKDNRNELHTQVRDLQIFVSTMHRNRMEADALTRQFNQALNFLRERSEESSSEIEKLNGYFTKGNDLKNTIVELNEKVGKLQVSVTSLEQRSEAVHEDMRKEIKELIDEVTETDKAVYETKASDLNMLKRELQETRKDLRYMQDIVTKLNTSNFNEAQRFSKLQTLVERIENCIQSSMNKLNVTQADLSAEMEELKARSDTHRRHVRALYLEQLKCNSSTQELLNQIEQSKSVIQGLKENINILTLEISNCNTSSNRLRTEVQESEKQKKPTMEGQESTQQTGGIVGKVVGVTLCVIVFMFLFSAFVYWKFGPQIMLYARRKTGLFQRKRGVEFLYDMTLYHVHDPDDHDERVAFDIQEKLTNQGYSIFGPKDIRQGQPKLSTSLDALHKGAVLGFVYSDNVTEDHLGKYILEVAGEERGYHNIVMIDCSSSKDRKQATVKWNKVMNNIRNGSHDSDVEILNLNFENQHSHVEEPIDRKHRVNLPEYLVKILKCIRWPGDVEEERIWDNFWCELQLFLPEKEKGRAEKVEIGDEHCIAGQVNVRGGNRQWEGMDNPGNDIEFEGKQGSD